jgi:hypothetical protein
MNANFNVAGRSSRTFRRKKRVPVGSTYEYSVFAAAQATLAIVGAVIFVSVLPETVVLDTPLGKNDT